MKIDLRMMGHQLGHCTIPPAPTAFWVCLKGARNEIYTCPRVFGVQEFNGDAALS